MHRTIRLLGHPSVCHDGQPVRGPNGRKAWALLAYLVLAERPPTRGRVSELLFPEPRDPLRALRWNLTELRRLLGGTDPVGGDPLALRLREGDDVDVHRVITRRWPDPGDLELVDGELLEGMAFDSTPAFASWLDLERNHLRAASEALLTEAAVAKLAGGDAGAAAGLAWRAVRLDELNAKHHALLVTALLATGDTSAARAHVDRCGRLYREGLGLPLPAEICEALEPALPVRTPVAATSSIEAALEAGRAAIAAGAVAHGVRSLRHAAGLARTQAPRVRAETLLELGGALVHSTGDRGVSSLRCLRDAFEVAHHAGVKELAAPAARELAFVQVQLGRRERADAWLDRAARLASTPAECSRILGVRGMNLSDAGRYDEAMATLAESVRMAEQAGHGRSAAWSRSLIGRIHLLRGDAASALPVLVRSADGVARERWTAFAPWVEALRAETLLALGRADEAASRAERSYALATAVADQCWIAVSGRCLALVRLHDGDPLGAMDWAHRSLRPEPWYLWTHGRALATAVTVATAAGDRRAGGWAAELRRVVGRAQLDTNLLPDTSGPSVAAP